MAMRTAATLALPVSARDHIDGPAYAFVTLMEYGDYECPYCGQAYVILQQLKDVFGEQLRMVFRHFPLTTIHPHAQAAAEAAEAAGAQGQFWEMHGMLFENQQALEDENLYEYAADIGLGIGRAALARQARRDVHRQRAAQAGETGVHLGADRARRGQQLVVVSADDLGADRIELEERDARLLRDHPRWAEKAERLAAITLDVSRFIVEKCDGVSGACPADGFAALGARAVLIIDVRRPHARARPAAPTARGAAFHSSRNRSRPRIATAGTASGSERAKVPSAAIPARARRGRATRPTAASTRTTTPADCPPR